MITPLTRENIPMIRSITQMSEEDVVEIVETNWSATHPQVFISTEAGWAFIEERVLERRPDIMADLMNS